MKDHLVEEELNRLLPALPLLAESIGIGAVPEKDVLEGILGRIGVEAEEWAVEELAFWSMILQRATTAATDDEKAGIVKSLQDRGIPQYPAILATDEVRRPRASVPTAVQERMSPEEDIQFEIGRRNFVRAAMLAQQHKHSPAEVRRLQELALQKYAFEYVNYPGLRSLMQEYELSEADLEQILGKSLREIEKE